MRTNVGAVWEVELTSTTSNLLIHEVIDAATQQVIGFDLSLRPII
jgi:hypothetical protein